MRRQLITAWLAIVTALTVTAHGADDLQQGFTQPPAWARPWVYWFPLNGNLTKQGVTADLEAMARVGIGGVLYMEVDQGAPKGPADYAGPLWRKLFQHACREAHRLGLELNFNNDAGWCGSGGPWITPELSMQRVVWTETTVQGPAVFDGALKQPQAVRGFYRDIAVLAMPEPAANARIPNIKGKALFRTQHFPPQPARFRTLPSDAVIPRQKIIDLSDRMNPQGRIRWNVPAGKWLILRLGHTTTGKENHPAPKAGRGLECDKLSKKAVETHFHALVGRLIGENKELVGQGKVFVSVHIDSWEVRSQNWTPRMRQEFQRRRGYDLWPFLPVFTGRVVDSLEVSERFLWDLRLTISEMLLDNYAGHMRALANRHGLRLSIEAYGEPADDMAYAGRADEPMAEFWSWQRFGADFSCTEMASAAHTYGKRILGAEAFTATNAEKWLGHPGNIKDLGDWAFCEGVNRFVFHRYAAQPWLDVAPGMSMGPWGLHYERTQTWWEQSPAWHQYLARCQFLLQQGLFVADVCYLVPEGAPRRFVPPPGVRAAPHVRAGYNFDGCTPEVVLTRMRVSEGRIVLPDGMSYRVLVLPLVETMTPELLRKIKELVEAGATVVAPWRPSKAPGLTNYPACDQEVRQLAAEIWGRGPVPQQVTERRLGRGRIVWGGPLSPPQAGESQLPPSIHNAKWIWRREGNPTVAVPPGTRYFRRIVTLKEKARIAYARLVMTCDNSFECWINGRRAGAGHRWDRLYEMDITGLLKSGENLIAVAATNGADSANPAGLIGLLTIRFKNGRRHQIATDRSWQAAQKVRGDWRTVLSAESADWMPAMELGPYGIPPWGEPGFTPQPRDVFPDAALLHKWLGEHGVPPDFTAGVPLRYIHRRIGDADVYFVANGTGRTVQTTCTFRVEGKQPELWHPETGHVYPLSLYAQRRGCTDVLLRLAPAESVFVVFRRAAQLKTQLAAVLRDGKPVVQLAKQEPDAAGGEQALIVDLVRREIWTPGVYKFKFATGLERRVRVAEIPPPKRIEGPWEVTFDPRWGGPGKVTFDKLEDWAKRPEEGIRYYSGTAIYRNTFHLDAATLYPHEAGGSANRLERRLHLDLGRVAVMARVVLNGRDLGTLWKPPFRVDVTEAVKPGENRLEIRVVNLWVNRQIGDEHLPEDSDRNPNGTLRSWPDWLTKGRRSPTGRYTFTSWRLWKKTDPLQPSGLLGPVTLFQCRRYAL